MSKHNGPKVLFLDIETKPLMAYVWSIWEQNVGLNQIESDWSILSFAARWAHAPAKQVIYQDLSKARDIEHDLPLLKSIWKLLDEADVVIAQNGVAFDKKKVYARFAIAGMPPPSSFRMVDTKLTAKKVFGFTSNRLEYLSDKLNKLYKKLKHERYPGFDLWKECMRGNQAAWREMRKYNIHDVLTLEELYYVLLPWDDTINFSVFGDQLEPMCGCGSTEFERRGYYYTKAAKYQRFCCVECGAWTRGRENLLPKVKRKSLHATVAR